MIVLHPDQNIFETNIVSFILQVRDKSAIVKKTSGSSDDDDSDRSNDSDWILAGTNRNNKSKVKATYNLFGGQVTQKNAPSQTEIVAK